MTLMIVLIADTPSQPDLKATLAGCKTKRTNYIVIFKPQKRKIKVSPCVALPSITYAQVLAHNISPVSIILNALSYLISRVYIVSV